MDIDKATEIINTVENIENDTEKNTNNNTVNIDNLPTKYKNLKCYNPNYSSIISKEEAKIRGRNGGLKSGENRAKRKKASELLARILATNMTDEQIAEVLGGADSLLNDDKSAYNVMLVKMTQQAMSGDTKAFIALRDTVGDKPIDKTEISAEVITEQDRKQIDKMRKQLMDISKIG